MLRAQHWRSTMSSHPASLRFPAVKIATKIPIRAARGGLRIDDYVSVVIHVACGSPAGLVSPESLQLLSIPVVVDEAGARRDNHSHEPPRLFRIGETVVPSVATIGKGGTGNVGTDHLPDRVA